ncbi:MAG TPA: 4-hydroxythreonine-4-phosphate dehydrogenase PdxA [Gammaproteobacteria bacterium]|nr:4-hydroxythreonine-4-phosphate dehydrogenase PdxA [Gammaproteobacteria bacterium]
MNNPSYIPKIVITPGEPAGIGPDLLIQLAQKNWSCTLVAIADPDLLLERARLLNLPLTLHDFAHQKSEHMPGHLFIIPEKLKHAAVCGQLSADNAPYVLRTLTTATQACLRGDFSALVTGPVHKGIINQAGMAFSGHTEFLAQLCGVNQVVMLLASDKLRVALVTTHLPLHQVPQAITYEKICSIVPILAQGLTQHFQIKTPHIIVAGLNPHAGEGGHLGDEEIKVIIPALSALAAQGYAISGPHSADTMFNAENLRTADVFLCMYHDQGLPVIKYASFGQTANITLGLPFLRTSVDHGTALPLAGTGKASAESFIYALKQCIRIESLIPLAN